MAWDTNYAVGGHQGLLVLGGVVVSGVRGATFNWNTRTAEGGGGWGDRHDYNVVVQQDAPTIDVEDPQWTAAQTAVTDLIRSMKTGSVAVAYLYPLAQSGVYNKYFYGSFILDEPSMELGIEDIVKLPFGLVAGRPDCGEFGI